MKRDHWSKILFASMMILAFAFVGCSDDSTSNTAPVPVDEFALVSPITDAYVSTYAPTGGGSGLGMNPSASAFYDVYFPVTKAAPNTDEFFVIDWRSTTAFGNAHIEGATNWALSAIIDHVDNGDVPADRTIVNVCYTGQTASTATAILNLLGYDAVNLVFGMSGWTSNTSYVGTDYMTKVSDDYDSWFVTTNFPKPTAGLYPGLDTGEVIATDIIKSRADAYVKGELNTINPGSWNILGVSSIFDAVSEDNGEWFVVNYFPNTEYQAGHMPTAVQYVPKTDLLASSNLSTLPTDTKIAVYCWTGQTSAQMSVLLNILGYEAYSVSYGVQSMCYTNASVNTHPYHVPTTDYPCVGTGVQTSPGM
jgi:rhodanese-related sulfurtransferase